MNQGRPAYLENQLQKIPAGELEVIHRSVFGQDHPHVTDRVLAKTEGKGRMEVYSVYPGIDVSYTAFLSAEATFHHAASPAIVELFYCHSGRVGWNMREGTAVYLGAGDLTVHSAACCADSAMMFPLGYAEGIAISIRLASLSDNESAILREVGREREKIQSVFCCGKPVILSSCPDLERIFAPLYAASPARRSLYLPLKIQELLLFLLDFQPEQNALTQYCSQQTEQIRRVHQQLTEHLDQRFTIEALSKQYLMNTATLKKVFKAVYGLPIATYMKEYRIRQAMKLLRETDAPIAEIASQVGYGTQGKFSEAFKDVAQMLPTTYRKAHVSSDRASEARP